jgi:surface antigen
MKCDIFDLYPKKSKTMQKSKLLATFRGLNTLGRLSAVIAVSAVIIGGSYTSVARADEYDAQIQALQQENSAAQGNVDILQAQASSYQDVIAKLQAQISAIQEQINFNLSEQERLNKEIAEKQAEIDRQRYLLGEDVKAMYEDGQMTTIEMLATSNNLSDFVDKEEYRNAVQENIQQSLAKIAILQNEMKLKKVQVDQLLESIKAQQAQLAADQAQQSQMLAYTEAQKNQYNQQISSNSSKIADLKRQQIIANSRYNIGPAGTGVNCGGGYPARWCEIPMDSVIDSWGMYNRECVSFTAFKVHQDFLAGRNNHDMPYWGGIGNANQWDDNARRAGIPVDSNPAPGSIAVSNAGYYGHVMYVEQVGVINGQQAIYVSQYNAGWDGKYSEGWRYTNGLVFIHF